VPGDTTRYTATGLDNNAKYVFTIKAQNRVDYSLPRSSPEMQPLGTPSPPPAPAVTDLESGANQTNLRISWEAVLPEGPGPTAYTVTYTNGSTSGAVPGCQKLVALSCTHAGVPYDGLTYTYRVVAANEPGNRSQPSEATSIEAVGRPAAWGAFRVYPTGNSQEAEVLYTVPDSRGTVSKVEILVGGSVVRTFAQQTGTNTTRILTPSNEQPFQVQLRVCNEDAPAGCTVSSAQDVQTYGRLDGMLDEIADPVVNGKTITWTLTGSSNGDPAELAYWFNGVQQPTINLPQAGAFNQSVSFTTPEFAQEVRLEVRLRDSSPGGRGETYRDDRATSGVPQPGVSVEKRASCRDDDSDASNNCWEGNGNNKPPACELESCGFIRFTVSGFYEDFTCRVSMTWNPYGGWATYSFSNPVGGQVSQDTNWYAPTAGGATVTCQGSGFWQRTSSGSQTW
jgi:hypothetical protein